MSKNVQPILSLDEREEALWMLQRLFPGEGISNIGLAVYLSSRADPEIMRKAAVSVVQRHAMLRSLVRVQDGRACRVLRDPAEVSLLVDTRTSTRASLEADLRDVARQPFDLGQDELTRFTLFELPDASQVLLVTIHHLAIDALAVPQFLNDLASAYQTLASGSAQPSEAQRVTPVRETPPPAEESLRYWRERMGRLRPGNMLLSAVDYVGTTTSFAGGRFERAMSASVADAVRELRLRTRASDNVVLLAAYLTLLMRHGAGPDLVVGLPVSLRTDRQASSVGNYFSTVPLAVSATPLTTFTELVDDTLTAFIEAFEHRDLSYEGMVSRFGHGDQDWQTPLFRHMFNFLPSGPKSVGRQDWAAETKVIDTGYSRYDLEFVVSSSPKGYSIQVAYRSDLHDESFVRRLADRYEVLLSAAASDPEQAIGRLPMTTFHDKVVERANQTTVTWPGPRTTAGMITAEITDRPADVAIASPESQLTYQRLGQLARLVGARLTARDIGSGDVVAVATGRGPATAAAILATWGIGAAYLPMDPAQPAERLRYQLRDSGASALVADSETITQLADPTLVLVQADPTLVLVQADEALFAEPASEEADAGERPLARCRNRTRTASPMSSTHRVRPASRRPCRSRTAIWPTSCGTSATCWNSGPARRCCG